MSNDDDITRRLADAFDAQASAAVPDNTRPPAPRFAAQPAHHAAPSRRRGRWAAPLAAAAAVIAIVTGVLVVSNRSDDKTPPPAAASHSRTTTEPTAPSSSASSAPAAKQVRLTTVISDGATYGVGMPVIVFFSKRVTDARAFQAATRTTANDRPLETAWYFQYSSAGKGPIEAQLRPRDYWPANSKIHVEFPAAGTSLGGRFVSDGKLQTLDFTIGARQVATVDDATHRLTLTVNGRRTATYPVSLGADKTPTQRGVKVIMEKGASISMSGPGYNERNVQFTQRLTYGGEYLHSAPWNLRNISRGIDSSNGCTNLTPSAAKSLYSTLRVGDVVTFPDANGPQMQVGQGYGAWNLPWQQWLTGGLVRTH